MSYIVAKMHEEFLLKQKEKHKRIEYLNQQIREKENDIANLEYEIEGHQTEINKLEKIKLAPKKQEVSWDARPTVTKVQSL